MTDLSPSWRPAILAALAVLTCVALAAVLAQGMHDNQKPALEPATGSGGQEDPTGSLQEQVGYTHARFSAFRLRGDRAFMHCIRSAGFVWQDTAAEDPIIALAPRGLFDKATPLDVSDFRRTAGYGAVRRVDSLLARPALLPGEDPNAEMVSQLDPDRAAKIAAIIGTDGSAPTGCVKKGKAALGDMGPNGEGALDTAYTRAINRLLASAEMKEWESNVLGCTAQKGVEAKSLHALEVEHLRRVLDAAGAAYTVLSNGELDWQLSDAEASRIGESTLEKLRVKEMADAAIEADCREAHALPMRGLIRDYTGPLAAKFPEQVRQLSSMLKAAEQ